MELPDEEAISELAEDEPLRVSAPIRMPGTHVEVMYAAPDPATRDQAILLSTPLLVSGVNFGDIVRIAPEDGWGVCRILEVVEASGHSRVMAYSGDHEPDGLRERLAQDFPGYALRVEAYDERLLGISVHPDVDPEAVIVAVLGWLDEQPPVDEPGGVTEPVETELGPIEWPEEMPDGPYTRVSP